MQPSEEYTSASRITPLQMAIFLPHEEIKDAVDMILDSGITADVSSGEIRWDTHDIDLDGTALEWAVGTRNRPLVSMPYSTFFARDSDQMSWTRDGEILLGHCRGTNPAPL